MKNNERVFDKSIKKKCEKYLPPFVTESTHAQCLQQSSSGIGTIFGVCCAVHFRRFGGFGATV